MRKDKGNNFTVKACTGLLLALILTVFTAFSAMALVIPDLTQSGSISLALIDKTTGKAIPGGELEIIQVAEAVSDNGFKFVPMGAFDDASFTFDLSETADLSSPDLAQAINAFADNHKGTLQNDQVWKVKIGQDGQAKLTGLSLGLYLVRQSAAAEGYSKVNPFLVTVPMSVTNEAGEVTSYIYDVDATPKPEQLSPEPVTTTQEEETQPEKAPQTGQLWWPAWVLGTAGILFLAAGLILYAYRKKIDQCEQDRAE